MRSFAAGQLVSVQVPTLEHEQLRDLARCREDARQDLMRAKHRIGKFLLRREVYYPGRGRAWTREHRSWLASLRFTDAASEATFADYLHAHDVLAARRDQLDRAIYRLAGECSWQTTIARLRCLHGIDTLGAFGLCAEVCDFARFPKALALSAYLGLVPCENTSGEKRRLGSITKAGSTLARRLLVEAAYHYRRPPRVGGGLMRRQDGAEPWVIDLSWRAQRRLAAGGACAPSAPSTTASPRSPSPANWPTSAGSSPSPTDPARRRLSRRRAPGPSRKPFATEL
jgi:transposase